MLLNSSRNRNFSPRGKITSARINQNGNFHQIQILSRSLCLPSVTKTIKLRIPKLNLISIFANSIFRPSENSMADCKITHHNFSTKTL